MRTATQSLRTWRTALATAVRVGLRLHRTRRPNAGARSEATFSAHALRAHGKDRDVSIYPSPAMIAATLVLLMATAFAGRAYEDGQIASEAHARHKQVESECMSGFHGRRLRRVR